MPLTRLSFIYPHLLYINWTWPWFLCSTGWDFITSLIFNVYQSHYCRPSVSVSFTSDDLQIYLQTSLDHLAETIDNINSLEVIKQWSKRFGVSVNSTKSQSIIVGGPRFIIRVNMSKLLPILYNGSIIPFSSAVEDQGLWIDSSPTWKLQIENVSRKAAGTFCSLYWLKISFHLPLS